MIGYDFFVFVLGAGMGSFLNVIIYRHYGNSSVVLKTPSRSACLHCGKKIRVHDLIPVISYLVLRGHCRDCKSHIPIGYLLVEVVTGVLFLAAYHSGLSLSGIGGLFAVGWYGQAAVALGALLRVWYVLAVAIALFVIDARYQMLPDRITVPAIGILFLSVPLTHPLILWSSAAFFSWYSSALVLGILGAAFFAIPFILSRGRWVGGGDIRMGAMIGVLFGWPMALPAFMLSFIAGGMVAAISLILRKKHFGDMLPMGSFLSMGTIMVLLWGQEIMLWYQHLINRIFGF